METQELTQSQDDTVTSSQYLSCGELISENWACVEFLPKKIETQIIALKHDKIYFGREEFASNDNSVASFVFNEKDFRENDFKRMSKQHFLIEKMKDSDCQGCIPAVLICLGRNGLFVDGNLMKLNEKRILKEGGIIKLVRGPGVLKFTYKNLIGEKVVPVDCDIHKNYFIGDTLGKGGCGTVYRIIKLSPSDDNEKMPFKVHALKIIEHNTSSQVSSLSGNTSESHSQLMNEVKLMTSLNHVHILEIFNYYETNNSILMVLPYLGGGDMLYRITQHDKTKAYLSERDSKFFITQLLMAIKYLHSQNIAHRDIKPENLLLTDKGDSPLLKVADFGLSKMKETMNTVCGTRIYAAPEILSNTKNYTNKVDIWSSGCLLYAMLSGRVPFSSRNESNLARSIINAKYTFEPKEHWQKNVSSTARNVIVVMLQKNPVNRYSADILLNHCWFRDGENNDRLNRAYDCYKIATRESTSLDLSDEFNKTLTLTEQQQPKRRRIN